MTINDISAKSVYIHS